MHAVTATLMLLMALYFVARLVLAGMPEGTFGALRTFVLFPATAMFGLFALRQAMRTTPLIHADKSGILAATFGRRQVRIPWYRVRGFQIYGKGKSAELAILVDDPAALFRTRHPSSQQQYVELLNKKRGVSAGAWLLGARCREPLNQIQSKLEAMHASMAWTDQDAADVPRTEEDLAGVAD